jgi:hypothetical protein
MSEKVAALQPHYGTPERAKVILAECEEKLFTWMMLGGRWSCHPKVAARRWKDLGSPVVRFNSRTACVKLSDILEVERAGTV